MRPTHPVDHGVLVRREGGQGVAVVRLAEHLQHRLGPRLLAGSTHRASAGLRAQLVQVGPRRDGVLEPQRPRRPSHDLVLPQERNAVHLLNVGHEVVVWKIK